MSKNQIIELKNITIHIDHKKKIIYFTVDPKEFMTMNDSEMEKMFKLGLKTVSSLRADGYRLEEEL